MLCMYDLVSTLDFAGSDDDSKSALCRMFTFGRWIRLIGSSTWCIIAGFVPIYRQLVYETREPGRLQSVSAMSIYGIVSLPA